MAFQKTFRSVWLWSLAFFVLAALTGFLYRFGMNFPLSPELGLNNIRHAHSHLMFFNWVTPIPMLFIASYVIEFAPAAARAFKRCIYTVLALGFASYPFFLLYGYQPVILGTAELPFSVIFSGLVMIAWYRFVWIYIKHRPESEAGLPRMFYDASLLMLVICTLGAWGVAVYQFSDLENPMLSTALTHFFLAVFTEGWCMLSVLGMIYHLTGPQDVPFHLTWLLAPIVLGVPMLFPFGLSPGLLTDQLVIAASFGAIFVTIGLAANFYLIWSTLRRKRIWWWHVVVNLLLAKILVLFGGGVLPLDFWIGEHGLRVFYLHLTLLGFVTVSYLAAWHTLHPFVSKIGFKLLVLSVLILLAMLLFISGMLPSGGLGVWIHKAVLVASILPVLAAMLEWKIAYTYTGSPR